MERKEFGGIVGTSPIAKHMSVWCFIWMVLKYSQAPTGIALYSVRDSDRAVAGMVLDDLEWGGVTPAA